MHWCSLRTKPHKEQDASSFLESKGYEAYLPSMPMRNRIQGKIVPLSSCYLFLHAGSPLEFSTVAWTPGLRPILSFGGELTPVPNQGDALISDRLAHGRKQGSPRAVIVLTRTVAALCLARGLESRGRRIDGFALGHAVLGRREEWLLQPKACERSIHLARGGANWEKPVGEALISLAGRRRQSAFSV